MGDPHGIGPELVLRVLGDAALVAQCRPVVVGSAVVLRRHAQSLGLPVPDLVAAPNAGGVPVVEVDETLDAIAWGQVSAVGGRFAMEAVEAATDLCLQGRADAMVTAPLSKEAIRRAGYTNPGHTEFIAGRAGQAHYAMMMVAGPLRVGLVTGHVPLCAAANGVTEAAILDKLRVIDHAVRDDFGVAAPRIAVLGLNPHAGDGGAIGDEEGRVVEPALRTARASGIDARGPFPADGFFGLHQYEAYDAVLAMYHDQGLVPFKALAFDEGVNYTAGLPLVRTSPGHGTAFGIAGQGRASAGSMRSAVRLALDVARRRAARQAQP